MPYVRGILSEITLKTRQQGLKCTTTCAHSVFKTISEHLWDLHVRIWLPLSKGRWSYSLSTSKCYKGNRDWNYTFAKSQGELKVISVKTYLLSLKMSPTAHCFKLQWRSLCSQLMWESSSSVEGPASGWWVNCRRVQGMWWQQKCHHHRWPRDTCILSTADANAAKSCRGGEMLLS